MNNSNQKQDERISIQSFNLISVIGKGAYAKVVLVRKKDNGKLYALKVLKKSLLSERKICDKVLTERDILMIIDHPFIVKLYYSFQSDTKLYFCIEFCQGGDLFNLLCNNRKLRENDAKFYAAQILLALQHLHERNILYRDLKPENVLIDYQGYIKITDFGLSKRGILGNEGARSVCGTPEYMAPEILQSRNYGKSADWWTFASIIYEMVVGYPPFINQSGPDDLSHRIQYKYLHQQNYFITQKCTIPTQFISQPKVHTPYKYQIKRNLLEQLFIKDPKNRLGFLNGAKEIQESSWFKGFDWNGLITKQLQPPFIPDIKNDDDLNQFGQEFINMEIQSNESIQELPGKSYRNFTYPLNESQGIKTQSQTSQSPELVGYVSNPETLLIENICQD